ncbi:serine/threonine-protein kinase [Luedemannella helvata]|uniref:non-specific serine/threonine protein kinase n=1 Tax=Luedemannella helvata TaxID=349315 RepID=A0ABP4WJZ9_9ACTN
MQILGGRYRLVELIGTGGMAVVWRAFDEVLGRAVAVKVLTSDLAEDPDFRRRIREEARAAARLAHPHVSVVHDYGEWIDANDAVMPYVVMELIDGPSLREVLRKGSLPWTQAAAVVAQVAAGLAAAHARGLVHRDVKPANVVLAPTGAKLVDFGISTITGAEETSAEVMGTPAYLAPERISGKPASPAVDVYALGLLLYQAVAGALPWQVDGQTAMLLAHLQDDPRPLPDVAGQTLPIELTTLVERCLVKDPDQRPAAADVAGELIAMPGVAGAAIPGAEPERSSDGDQTAFVALPFGDRRASGRAEVLTRETATESSLAADRRRWLWPVATGTAAVAIVAAMAGASALDDQQAGGSAAPPTVAPSAGPSCQAVYQTRTDDGRRFAGQVTVINTGAQPLRDWTLSFRYPSDQRAVGSHLTQTGSAVSVGPIKKELAAGRQATYEFHGTYGRANPMPQEFSVDEIPCDVRLMGPVAYPQPTPPKPEPADEAKAPKPDPKKAEPAPKGPKKPPAAEGPAEPAKKPK